MGAENERPPTFVEWVLALLEERFHGWIGTREPVGGADTVDDSPTCTSRYGANATEPSRENGDPQVNGIGRRTWRFVHCTDDETVAPVSIP